MTPTWFKHISYQIFAFLVSVAMIIGVAEYAITKSYDARELSLRDGFTITAHTGSYNTPMNSLEYIGAALENNADIIELDIRQRPDETVVMSHDFVVTNHDGVPVADAFNLLKGKTVRINLDIKETRTLNNLHKLLVEYNLLENAFLTGIETKDINAVKESDCKDMVFYINYSPSRTKIFMEEYRQKLLDMLEESGAVGLNCNYKYVGISLSELLHTNGYKLSVWTVDTEINIKKMLVVSPDNITTKNVDLVHSVIDNWGK